jgi:hypothetical protein
MFTLYSVSMGIVVNYKWKTFIAKIAYKHCDSKDISNAFLIENNEIIKIM